MRLDGATLPRSSPLSKHRVDFDFPAAFCYIGFMPGVAEPLVAPDISKEEKSKESLDPGYLVICWDDPINTMQYVTHVFQKVFGWDRQLAEKRMLEVHNNGKSVLTRETMEKAEYYVHQLQQYLLHATMEKAES
jgi:ATP-dependent Clp protease adaptor protein ClpS